MRVDRVVFVVSAMEIYENLVYAIDVASRVLRFSWASLGQPAAIVTTERFRSRLEGHFASNV